MKIKLLAIILSVLPLATCSRQVITDTGLSHQSSLYVSMHSLVTKYDLNLDIHKGRKYIAFRDGVALTAIQGYSKLFTPDGPREMSLEPVLEEGRLVIARKAERWFEKYFREPDLLVPQVPAYPAEWKAVNPRKWKYIVVHHSATNTGGAAAFHRAHLARGWENGLGYHFVIGNGSDTPKGAIEVGPRWRKQLQGAHAGNKLYNEAGIGICLVGDFDHGRPSAIQLAALKRLIKYLQAQYSIPDTRIVLHRDVRNTDCPGRHFTKELLR